MSMDELKNIQEGGNFIIENAKPEDVEKIRNITRESWLEIYPNETHDITREDIEAVDFLEPVGLERRKKEIKEKRDTIHVWVVKDNKDNVVGFCKASKGTHGKEEQKEIDAMYLTKEFQGKGLGKKLMQKALEWLGGDGDIRLEVVSYNNNAINFYKGFGFKETTNPPSGNRTELPSKKVIPRIVMIRKVE